MVQAIAAVTLSLELATALFRKQVAVHATTCDFPAVFNFGDSNSDTGGKSAAFHRLPYSNVDENADENGCVKSQNEIAQEFNKQLKDSVSQLGDQHPDAEFTYTYVYAAKYSLISEAKRMAFADPLGYCCGHYGGDYQVPCGKKVTVNGTEFSMDPCSDPKLYISWDGMLPNQIVADRILVRSSSSHQSSTSQVFPIVIVRN